VHCTESFYRCAVDKLSVECNDAARMNGDGSISPLTPHPARPHPTTTRPRRAQAEQQLRSTRAGPEDRQRMLEVFQKLHDAQREDGGDELELLQQALAAGGSGTAASESDLLRARSRSQVDCAGDLDEEELDELAEDLAALLLRGAQQQQQQQRGGNAGVGGNATSASTSSSLAIRRGGGDPEEEEEDKDEEEAAERAAAEAALARAGAVLSKDTLKRLLAAVRRFGGKGVLAWGRMGSHGAAWAAWALHAWAASTWNHHSTLSVAHALDPPGIRRWVGRGGRPLRPPKPHRARRFRAPGHGRAPEPPAARMAALVGARGGWGAAGGTRGAAADR